MPEDPNLERRLEAMFASARPRRAFEDQLWKRIQAQRPWPRRLLDWFRAPAHLAPALAALVVVAGVGWLATNFHAAGGTADSATSAGSGAARAVPLFGVLPRPETLASASGADNSARPTLPAEGPGVSPALAGQAPGGAVKSVSGSLTVYRYDEPSPSSLAAAATALSDRSGLPVQVLPGDPATGRPPTFQLSDLADAVGPEGEATAAQAFLGAHNLLPQYQFQVLTGADRVVYNQLLVGVAAGPVPVVGVDGAPAGLEVDFSGGRLVSVRGPLELALASSPYPVQAPPRTAPGGRLVYALVVSGGHGYYEPELLQEGGLRPVIAPQWLAR